MIARSNEELKSFHEFVGERLLHGDAVIFPEQALALRPSYQELSHGATVR